MTVLMGPFYLLKKDNSDNLGARDQMTDLESPSTPHWTNKDKELEFHK
jgi:hypothetical protein